MDRLHDFKNKGKSSTARNRRRENAFELRKKKRLEQAQKRRNMVEEPEENSENIATNGMNSGAQQQAKTGKPQPNLENLEASIHTILNSDDFDAAFEATRLCRRTLAKTAYLEDGVKLLRERNVLPRLVEFLTVPHEDLVHEAAWALTNVASGTSDDTLAVANTGCVPVLVSLITPESEKLTEQCLWCLANIAGDGPELRDMVLGASILDRLIPAIHANPGIVTLQVAVWCLSNLCRFKRPQPNFELVRHTIPTFVQMVKHEDQDVRADALWGLSYVSDGDDTRIQAVLEANAVGPVLEQLHQSSNRILVPALRCIGNFVSGSDHLAQVVADAGAVPVVASLTQHRSQRLRKDACWALSNIAAGTRSQANLLLECDAITGVLECLANGEFRTRKEACFCIRNLTDSLSDEAVQYMAQMGVIPPLVEVLSLQDVDIVEQSLNAIRRMLKASAMRDGSNASADLVEECGGVDTIELLQQHENDDIYELALAIVDEFFGEEDEEVADMAPQQTENGFAFAAPSQQAPFSL